MKPNLPAEENFQIELSAEDLRKLCYLTPSARPQHAVRLPASALHPPRAIWRSPLALGSAVMGLILVIGAGYRQAPPDRAAATPPPAVSPKPKILRVAEVSVKKVDEKPVRIRNPFDKHEVFEFPPGTSKQQAHDAVADMLLQRAMERQAQYDAKRAKRRRAT